MQGGDKEMIIRNKEMNDKQQIKPIEKMFMNIIKW